jgi:FMN-dependent oxidoreductase (nitrilotriacetate monooxygenase family)
MTKNKKIHLAQFLVHGPTYHSIGMWRHPKTIKAGYDWRGPELYQHIAQVCERGLFDTVFFADLNYIADTYTGSLGPTLRNATQVPEHDPIPLLSFMAAATKTIGVASTFSVSHSHPFYASRLWATLDHLTKGRAGWNVVTSMNGNQAANYGEKRQPSDARYEKAHEFMEVCKRLWDSWESDALVMDHKEAIFADSKKVHRIDHKGRFFSSRGPLNVTRSPQNGPAILQAGTSPKGQDFAVKYADAIFAIQPRSSDAANYFSSIKGQMSDIGRDPESCKILFGMQPIIGRSEEEAVELQEEHNELVPLEGGLAYLSAHLDFDLSKIPLDAILSERREPELYRMRTRFKKVDGTPMTLKETAMRHGQSVGLPQFLGTPKSIADQMEAFMADVGGDGFMVSAIHSPGAIEEFVDLIVPELQRRGLFRTEYKGKTQREILNQTD